MSKFTIYLQFSSTNFISSTNLVGLNRFEIVLNSALVSSF